MTRRELREHCFKLLFCADFYPTDEMQEQVQSQPAQAVAAVDTVAEIQKYKLLFDAGVLTEEEFAAKKKQLLGI